MTMKAEDLEMEEMEGEELEMEVEGEELEMEEGLEMEEEEAQPTIAKPVVTKSVAKPSPVAKPTVKPTSPVVKTVANTAKPVAKTVANTTKPVATKQVTTGVKIASEKKIIPKTTTAAVVKDPNKKPASTVAVIKSYEDKKAAALEKFTNGTGGMPLVTSTVDDLIFSKQHEAGFGFTKEQTAKFMELARDVMIDIIKVGGSFKVIDNAEMSAILRAKVVAEDEVSPAPALPTLVNQGVTHILKRAGHISLTCKFTNKLGTTANGYINDQDEFVIVSNE